MRYSDEVVSLYNSKRKKEKLRLDRLIDRVLLYAWEGDVPK